MSDSSAPPAPPEDEPIAFTPVPGRARHDGWTPNRQRDFIAALARIGLVSAAAQAIGLSAKSAYALRRRAGAESFAAAWNAALTMGRDNARGVAIDRALNGVEKPIYYRGRQVGTRRVFNDRLLIAALRGHGFGTGQFSLDYGV